MTQRLLVVIAVVILAVCLVSGGCHSSEEPKAVKTWKDLVNLLPEPPSGSKPPDVAEAPSEEPVPSKENRETLQVSLYFVGADGQTLAEESRIIPKEEGIARRTVNELIKGPQTAEYLSVFPEGTRLLDINVKPEGLCIVDLSKEARQVANGQQEELMVMALVNTVGQFPTVTEVSFMIEGQPVQEIAGFMDLSQPVQPD